MGKHTKVVVLIKLVWEERRYFCYCCTKELHVLQIKFHLKLDNSYARFILKLGKLVFHQD